MPLLSAPPFDPCLMRVLDHQYSNYITWKKGKTLFFPSRFSQCNPSASLMLSFLMHCLCYLFYSLVILILKSFTICIWCTYFVPTHSAVIIIFPLLVCSLSKPFFKAVRDLFHAGLLAFLLPLTCFAPDWYKTCCSTKRALFSPHMDEKRRMTYCNCMWMDKIGYNKRSSDYWHRTNAERVISH